LDMQQPQKMLEQLNRAASPMPRFTQEFSLIQHRDDPDHDWWSDVSSLGLIQTGLKMLGRWVARLGE
jgi:hypothetical protein